MTFVESATFARWEWLVPLVLFSFAAFGTPGPNNAMLAASGAAFGVRRTQAHALGVSLGFPLMMMTGGLALSTVFATYPTLALFARWLGAAVLVWFAWRIATAGSVSTESPFARKPMTFIGAAAFQWVNPKGWATAFASVALFVPDGEARYVGVLAVAVIAAGVTICTSLSWTTFGAITGRVFATRPRAMLAFNIMMGALLVLSAATSLILDLQNL